MKATESKTTTFARRASNTPTVSKGGDQAFFNAETQSERPFFASDSVQTKLDIGAPDDKYEKEADSVADRVVSKKEEGGDSVHTSLASQVTPLVQRQPMEEEEEAMQMKVQRQEEEEEEMMPKLQLQEEEEEAMQMKVQRQEEEEEEMMPKLQLQEEEEEAMQMKVQRQEEEEEEMMPKLQFQEEEEEAMQMKVQRQEEEEEEMMPKLQFQEEEEEAMQMKVQRQEEEEEEMMPKLQLQEEEEEAMQMKIQRQEEEEEEMMPKLQLQEEEEEAMQMKIQRQEEEEEEMMPKLQLQEEEEEAMQMKVQREEEEEEATQLKVQRQEEEEEMLQPKLQKKESEKGKKQAPISAQLKGEMSGGSAMSGSVKSSMESSFGADFSDVRIHNDSASHDLSQQLGAQAFTTGDHVFFNKGKYNPDSQSGKHLLAHELTHVIQQKGGDKPIQRKEMPALDVSGKQTQTQKESSGDGDPFTPANEQNQVQAQTQDVPSGNDGAGGGGNNTGTNNTPSDNQDDNSGNQDQVAVSGDFSGGGGGDSGPPPEVQKTESLGFEGDSTASMTAFTNASASQIAASYPQLGSALDGKVAQEQTQMLEATPELKANSSGTTDPDAKEEITITDPNSADISEGAKGPEPPPIQKEEYEDLAPPPNNENSSKSLDQQESGGFLSWFKDKFTNFMSSISTTDPGVNTSAGARPVVDTSGKADINRSDTQRNEGDTQVNEQQTTAQNEIKNNPGQQNIQPIRVDESNKISLQNEPESIETTADEGMGDYVSLGLPENVRTLADKNMAPRIEQSLLKPREDVKAAANERDTEKQAAIQKAEEDTRLLNEDADKKQKEEVIANRKKVADEQQAGIHEADEKIKSFKKETDEEQSSTKDSVKKRIDDDETAANKKLTDAEADADKKKKEGEKEAAEKKKKLERESKSDSWWDRAVNAVKSAVKAITSAIDAVFNAVRAAVKSIIDAAKNAAIALIEAGRKWIVDQLDKFGNWLKSQVSKYLKAFPELAKRINNAIDATVDVAKKAVNTIADGLKKGVTALADTLGKAIDSVLDKFQKGLKAAVQVAGALLTGDFAEALKIAFVAACEIAGINPQPVLDFIEKAKDKLLSILKNPVGFIGNVMKGVMMGVNNFQKNIKQHLIAGLLGWLTGALSEAKLTMPQSLDFKGVFSLASQILGLTWENIRAKVVKRLGPKGETMISTIEKSIDIVKRLVTEGPIALVDMVKEQLSNLKTIVLEGIRNFVITTVVKEGIMWLLGLLNPAAAIVKAVKLLFDLVMFFIERWQQIIDFGKSVFNSVSELANGNLTKAAKAVEEAMARSLPVVISLVANLAGLRGIGKTVQNIVKKVSKPVGKVIDKVVDKIVKGAKKLFKKAVGGAKKAAKKLKEKVVNWWNAKKSFKNKGGESHTLYIKGKGKSAKLMIKSTPQTVDEYVKKELESLDDQIKNNPPNVQDLKKQRKALTDAKTKIDAFGTHIVSIPQSDALRNEVVDDLTKISKEFMKLNGNVKKADMPEPIWKPVRTTSGAYKPVDVKVDKLSKEYATGGGVPEDKSVNSKVTGWPKIIKYGLTSIPNKWVQMHLINEKIGGKGKPFNLVPGPNNVNSGTMRHFESIARKLILDNPKNVVWWHTHVDYHTDTGFEDYASKVTMKAGLYVHKGNNEWAKDPNPKFQDTSKVDKPDFSKKHLPSLSNPSRTAYVNIKHLEGGFEFSYENFFSSTIVSRMKWAAKAFGPFSSVKDWSDAMLQSLPHYPDLTTDTGRDKFESELEVNTIPTVKKLVKAKLLKP